MIRAILFDKDGTLTDFRKTWEPFMAGMIRELAEAGETPPERVADGFGFDLTTDTIPPDAPFVTEPTDAVLGRVASVIGWDHASLSDWVALRADAVAQVMVPGADETLARLTAMDLRMGVLTNATAAGADRHLRHMGLRPAFDRIIGYDSGFGAKPDPRGAADFADALGFARSEVLLVGDGMTDMDAARGAGLSAVAVLTGTLGRAALEPHAKAVLPDITHLPDWLAAA